MKLIYQINGYKYFYSIKTIKNDFEIQEFHTVPFLLYFYNHIFLLLNEKKNFGNKNLEKINNFNLFKPDIFNEEKDIEQSIHMDCAY